MSRKKLSKTVLEMKFMKRTKIQQNKHDEETENLDVLTDQKVKGERLTNFVIERNWELIENLRTSRLNYGMKKTNQEGDNQDPNKQNNQDDNDESGEPKAKHIRFNND